jgi:hypothetical protein
MEKGGGETQKEGSFFPQTGTAMTRKKGKKKMK